VITRQVAVITYWHPYVIVEESILLYIE